MKIQNPQIQKLQTLRAGNSVELPRLHLQTPKQAILEDPRAQLRPKLDLPIAKPNLEGIEWKILPGTFDKPITLPKVIDPGFVPPPIGYPDAPPTNDLRSADLPNLDPFTQFSALLQRMFFGSPFGTNAEGQTVVNSGAGNDRMELRPGPFGGAYLTTNGQTYYLTADQAKNLELNGGAGNDQIIVDPDYPYGVEIHGGAGNDDLTGGRATDNIHGGTGQDVIFGNGGNDYIHGGADSDWIASGAGNDHVDGGHGADIIRAGTGNDVVHAGDGNDSVYGGNGNDELHGNAGDDYLRGGNGLDRAYGEAGNDDVRLY